jgi:hypothetical protein
MEKSTAVLKKNEGNYLGLVFKKWIKWFWRNRHEPIRFTPES